MAQQENNPQGLMGLQLHKLEPLPEGRSKTPKEYHAQIPGSTFIMRDGRVLQFNGAGHYSTHDLGEQFELDKIADKGGSKVYTKKPVVTYEDKQPTEDIQARAAEIVKQLANNQQKQVGG